MVAKKESDLQYPNMKADLELCYKQLFAICKGERGPLAVMSIPPRTDNFDMQFSAAFDELKAYRETGLEPEMAKELVKETLKLEEQGGFNLFLKWVQAEREGRLLVLPCPMGTKLWRVVHTKGTRFASESFYIRPITLDVTNVFRIVEQKEYGKIVFPTRKEAEKAMFELAAARMKEREEDE